MRADITPDSRDVNTVKSMTNDTADYDEDRHVCPPIEYSLDEDDFELRPLPVLNAADVLEEGLMEIKDAPTPEAKPKRFSITEEFDQGD